MDAWCYFWPGRGSRWSGGLLGCRGNTADLYSGCTFAYQRRVYVSEKRLLALAGWAPFYLCVLVVWLSALNFCHSAEAARFSSDNIWRKVRPASLTSSVTPLLVPHGGVVFISGLPASTTTFWLHLTAKYAQRKNRFGEKAFSTKEVITVYTRENTWLHLPAVGEEFLFFHILLDPDLTTVSCVY